MNGFDRTPHGEEIIALLRRAAPPRPDGAANARRVMLRIQPQARVHWLGWIASTGLVAAAAAVAVVVLFPPRVDAPSSTIEPPPTAPVMAAGRELDGIQVGVRSVDGGEITLDAGLSRGLRVGDELGSESLKARITAVGIFSAKARVESGKAERGQRLFCGLTEAMKREQRYEFVGGDPGALYDFGAVLENLPPQEAHLRGISSGRALVVVDVIGSILRSRGVEPSLAGSLGLQKGDVLVSCNGLPAGDLAQLTRALEMSRKSGTPKLTILRGTKELELAVK